MEKPLILVSNDDGYAAKGVHELIDILVKFGEVVAVCPDGPRSGQSMAITMNEPIRYIELPDYNGAKMYSVTGTPVDCVKLAMHQILPRKADLVVAGINHGSNAAINVLYSGTMGAATEGCAFGIPAIGFSLTDHSPSADFTPCKRAVDVIVENVLRYGLPEGVCLNVNIPNIDQAPKEMRHVRACRGNWNDEYKEYTDPFGRKFYWITGKFVNAEPENEQTDEWCLAHNIVSVVPTIIDRSSTETPEVKWLDEVCKNY